MVTDQIADYLTRIRNAQKARHKVVEIPASNLKKEITKILHLTKFTNLILIKMLKMHTILYMMF